MWKFVILIKSKLLVFFFINSTFDVSGMSSPNPRSPSFSPVLSPRSFIFVPFTFRPMIYFEFIFAKHVRSMSRFFLLLLLLVNVQLILYHLLETSLSPLNFLCQWLVDYICAGLFLDSLFCFIVLFVWSSAFSTQSWLLQL